ncbi:thioredoxin family protein [Robiginitalea sp. M366]|uniref:protein-disulfide reductase DsbD family protein n=1 Tax=Robiginitalea aestuariiviva TaxID=3036903 RepID=UPI00240D0AE9|nr:thioredoxin family protein [Robiginitalea aestuariiviva]MDG1572825.1 thioredoxin family protein [Robiginitalea aestuariiviva]
MENYLRSIRIGLLALVLPAVVSAQFGLPTQIEDPVQWQQSLQRGDSTLTLVMEAEIQEGWHLYTQYSDPNGAMPAEFEFVGEGTGYLREGPVEESETHTAYNDIFEVDETFYKEQGSFRQRIRLLDPELDQIVVRIHYQVCEEVCIPGDHEFVFRLKEGTTPPPGKMEGTDARAAALGAALKLDLKYTERLRGSDAPAEAGESSLWVIFGLGFLGGLIALLTPCVFPLIPLTVSFFTKQSGSRGSGIRRALWYGASIILIYFLLSLPFHFFDSVDSQILNSIATNIWLNLFFFVVFIAFALSFFGYYELTLPASWANRVDAASERIGGGVGIFFMALTLAIVSFSCTGPILGGLLGSTALSEGSVATNLTAGMLGFGVALALPFTVFALFPAGLSRLPASGGWMETVKVVLGFLELALAFKFLSNADLVGHWGLLKREVFLGIWIALALGLALYLLGVFRFKSHGGSAGIGWVRRALALASLAFAGYLAYGLVTRQPLQGLSGFPPPDFYSVVELESDCPLGLDCYKDFEAGLEVSRESGKPILLDFTGWACVNCRKMEEQVWSDPAVFQLLKDRYILVSLYVDDREALPEDQQFVYRFNAERTKRIQTIGDRWATFQTVNFGSVSQPYYVALSPDLEVLGPAVQTTDTETYREWLTAGLRAMEP